jgi:uncharacterized protein
MHREMSATPTTGDWPRPFPDPPLERWQSHFEGLKEGRILVRRCAECGALQWPPRIRCRACGGARLDWIDAATEGDVYTYSVCNRAFHPWFEERLPYALVLVECEPGVKVLGNCFSAAVAELKCGMRVAAGFDTRADGHVVLTWEPLA